LHLTPWDTEGNMMDSACSENGFGESPHPNYFLLFFYGSCADCAKVTLTTNLRFILW